jgi:hypothetical protein
VQQRAGRLLARAALLARDVARHPEIGEQRSARIARAAVLRRVRRIGSVREIEPPAMTMRQAVAGDASASRS